MRCTVVARQTGLKYSCVKRLFCVSFVTFALLRAVHSDDSTRVSNADKVILACPFDSARSARHHKYPFDYAASEFGVSTQFNPTKMVIDGFAKLGLVTNRKRAVGAWSKLKERRDNEEMSSSTDEKTGKMKST